MRATAFLELWQELLRIGPRPLVLGRGDNPINFVPVAAVADAVVTAALDPTLRGRVLDVVGPDDLTLNELAARTRPGCRPLHVPPTVLRLLARSTLGALQRQSAAALVLDSHDMRAASTSTTRSA